MKRVSVVAAITLITILLASTGFLLSNDSLSAEDMSLIERQILNATVRFQIDYWVVRPDEKGYDIQTSVGHGTVKDGRYLVTHNHFSEPFSEDASVNAEDIYTHIRLFDANEQVLADLYSGDVSIAVQDQESLVLDFGQRDGVGFFNSIGKASAYFENSVSETLKSGTRVAQIDWDGSTTRVDWTTVEEVTDEDGVTRLVMSDELLVGASGGGVFLNGSHIGNNWTTVDVYDSSGAVTSQYSTAALNSSQITGTQSLTSASTADTPVAFQTS